MKPYLLEFLLLAAVAVRAGAEETPVPVPPPGNIVADGVPPVSADLVETVGRYQQGRSAGFAGWHPVRREMLISTRFANTSQLHLVKRPGGARRQLTFRVEPVRGGSFQPGRGLYFTCSADTGGNENYQIYLQEVATNRTIRITDGTSRNGGGLWSHDGTRILYYSNGRNGRTNDFFIVELANLDAPRMIFEAPGVGWFVEDWSRDGKWILLSEYISINETRLHLLERTTGAIRRILPAEGEQRGAFMPAIFSADGASIFVGSNQTTEFRQLYEVKLSDGSRTALSAAIPWDVRSADLSPDGAKLAYSTNENGAGVLRLLDLSTREELPVPELPLGSVSGLEWHENGRDIGFNLNSSSSPLDAYSLNVETRAVERWTESETGPVNSATFSEPEIVRMTSFDGLQISAIAYRPDAGRFPGPRPVIVSIHGGPEGQSRPGFMGTYNYYIEELGVAIVLPNVRGSAGYGKSFLDLDNGFKREDSVRDIGAVLDWIESDPGFDGDRVAVRGGSYGGYMCLASMVHYSDRLRCGVDVVGISNFVTFLKNTMDYRRDLRRAEYGDERDPAMHDFLQKIAPAGQVEKITRPLLVVQGLNDPRVPESESSQMVHAIRENGASPVWYLLARDEGHGFRKKENRDFELLVTVQFIREYLLKE